MKKIGTGKKKNFFFNSQIRVPFQAKSQSVGSAGSYTTPSLYFASEFVPTRGKGAASSVPIILSLTKDRP